MHLNQRILLILLLCMPAMAWSQKYTQVELVHANSLEYVEEMGDVRRLIGNVIFKHEETFLYCDSAWLYSEANSVDAFSNVHIKSSDSLNLFGDTLHYDGNARIAELTGNVSLIDNQITLTTRYLKYNLNDKTATYKNGGKIVDTENVLTSETGYYFSNIKEFFFKDSVVLVNPEYTMLSDTLMYQTMTEVSYFFGPSWINSEDNRIYCENGWYDTRNDHARFSENAVLWNKTQRMSGDSLIYNRVNGEGEAYENVRIADTTKELHVEGGYARLFEKLGEAWVTDSALMGMAGQGQDTLWLHADTLKLFFDDSTKKGELLLAYYGARFYRNDLQGKCDSLVYDLKDSLISLYVDPLIWSSQNQLSAEFIQMRMKNNTLDSIFMDNFAFIISKDRPEKYNQVKGDEMTGYFTKGDLRRMFVSGPSNTIYYVRDENERLIGINKAKSQDLIIHFKDSEVNEIVYIKDVDGALHPEYDISQTELKLDGFVWRPQERPLKKSDLFIRFKKK